MGGGTPPADTTSTRGLVVGLVAGLPVIAYGVRGALVDAADTHPADLARWVVGAALVHDLLFAPLLLGLGIVLARLVTDDATRWVLRAGLIVSGSLALVAWPLVRGYGQTDAVPSLLPRDYTRGLVVYLVATWVAVATVLLVRRWRRFR